MRSWPWLLALLALGCAGRDPYRKIPPDERAFIEAVDILMPPETLEAWMDAPDAPSRARIAEGSGLAKKYEDLTEEERAAIAAHQVIVGMSKDAVIMSVGLPLRIRKQYEEAAGDYVESYQYRYERDGRGEVFVSPPNSRSAYKNEVFERHVEFVRDRVRAVKEVAVP